MSAKLKENRCPSCGANIHIPHNARTVVCKHCGTEFTLETPDAPTPQPHTYHDEIIALLHRDKFIDAVKLVRVKTGMGLKESKDYVERLAQQNNIDISARGCSTSVVITGIIAGVIVIIIVLIIMVFS
jgi:transcription elongation factor Elf1